MKLKCKKCKKKTKHKEIGFKEYNRRYECIECGEITWDNDNEK